MINSYTLLLNEMKPLNVLPKSGMVMFGTRLDRLCGYFHTSCSGVIFDKDKDEAVFIIEHPCPYIDTVNDIDYLYGLIGCDKIVIKPTNDKTVQINVHVKSIIKEDNN